MHEYIEILSRFEKTSLFVLRYLDHELYFISTVRDVLKHHFPSLVKRRNQMLTIPSERLGHTLVQYHSSAMLIGGEVSDRWRSRRLSEVWLFNETLTNEGDWACTWGSIWFMEFFQRVASEHINSKNGYYFWLDSSVFGCWSKWFISYFWRVIMEQKFQNSWHNLC